jgi:hypothetical protein
MALSEPVICLRFNLLSAKSHGCAKKAPALNVGAAMKRMEKLLLVNKKQLISFYSLSYHKLMEVPYKATNVA